jgi:hypothetical protein
MGHAQWFILFEEAAAKRSMFRKLAIVSQGVIGAVLQPAD